MTVLSFLSITSTLYTFSFIRNNWKWSYLYNRKWCLILVFCSLGIQTSLDCRLALTWLFYYWHRLSCLSPSLQASQMMMPTKCELFVLVSSPLSFDKVSIVFLCVYLSSWVCGYSTAIPYSRTGENSTVGGCFTGQIFYSLLLDVCWQNAFLKCRMISGMIYSGWRKA